MRERGRPRGIRWWVWIVLLVVGLAAVAAGFGWFLVILVAMSWLTVFLYRKAAPAAAGSAEPQPQPREMLAQPRRSVDTTLSSASTALLCELWSQTGQELRRTYLPSTVCSYAELRQAILDELTRREPDGVRRWLEDEPDRRDLRAYLHDHQR